MKKAKPLHLLVVEDNPGDMLLLEDYLQQGEIEVGRITHARNMNELAAMVQDDSFDLALLDLTLPDSTGTGSVVSLNRLLPQTPIIVFSGLSAIEIAMQAISLGAQDYLIKGEFDEKLLAKTIQYSIERKKTLLRLQQSHELNELVSRATNDVIYDWDFKSDEVKLNAQAKKHFGFDEEHSSNWLLNYIHPEDQQRVSKKLDQHIRQKHTNWNDEYRLCLLDGTCREVYARGFILFDHNGNPYRMIGALTDITELKDLQNRLVGQELVQQKLITETTLQAQEKERNELGKELHDNINQILATVKMFLSMAAEGHPSSNDLINRSFKNVNYAIEEIRKLSKSLVAPSLGDISLKDALQELADEISVSNKLKVTLDYQMADNAKPDDNLQLIIYRIVQEQLNNVLKHAAASHAGIRVNGNSSSVSLSITDDGKGFDKRKKINGIGLKNISSRIEFYKGDMQIITAPGKGCRLEVNLPIPQ